MVSGRIYINPITGLQEELNPITGMPVGQMPRVMNVARTPVFPGEPYLEPRPGEEFGQYALEYPARKITQSVLGPLDVMAQNVLYGQPMNEKSEHAAMQLAGLVAGGPAAGFGKRGAVNMGYNEHPLFSTLMDEAKNIKDKYGYSEIDAEVLMELAQKTGKSLTQLIHQLTQGPGAVVFNNEHLINLVKNFESLYGPISFPEENLSSTKLAPAKEMPEWAKLFEPVNWQEHLDPDMHPFSWPSIEKQRRAEELGFNTGLPLYKGMSDILQGEGFFAKSLEQEEPGLFASAHPEIANAYTSPNKGSVVPFYANPQKVYAIDWPKATDHTYYYTEPMDKLLRHARSELGADALIIKNIRDEGPYRTKAQQNQYVFFDPTQLRAPWAEFNPQYSSNLLSTSGLSPYMFVNPLQQQEPKK